MSITVMGAPVQKRTARAGHLSSQIVRMKCHRIGALRDQGSVPTACFDALQFFGSSGVSGMGGESFESFGFGGGYPGGGGGGGFPGATLMCLSASAGAATNAALCQSRDGGPHCCDPSKGKRGRHLLCVREASR